MHIKKNSNNAKVNQYPPFVAPNLEKNNGGGAKSNKKIAVGTIWTINLCFITDFTDGTAPL